MHNCVIININTILKLSSKFYINKYSHRNLILINNVFICKLFAILFFYNIYFWFSTISILFKINKQQKLRLNESVTRLNWQSSVDYNAQMIEKIYISLICINENLLGFVKNV